MSSDNRVEFVNRGISQGDLAGIIVGWVCGFFLFAAILGFLWALRHRFESDDGYQPPIKAIAKPAVKSERRAQVEVILN